MSDKTLQRLLDRTEAIDVVYRYATSIDTRDWELHRSIFTDEIESDFSTLGGGASAGAVALTADAWVDGLKALMPGFAATQHSMTNPRVTIDGDAATVVMYMQAEHYLIDGNGEPQFWSIAGYYTDQLVRRGDTWKIRKVQLTVTWQRGDQAIMGIAMERAAG